MGRSGPCDQPSAVAMGEVGRYASRQQNIAGGRSASVAVSADGAHRASVPCLPEFPDLSAMEPGVGLRDHGRLSGYAVRRGTASGARQRSHFATTTRAEHRTSEAIDRAQLFEGRGRRQAGPGQPVPASRPLNSHLVCPPIPIRRLSCSIAYAPRHRVRSLPAKFAVASRVGYISRLVGEDRDD